MFELRDFFHLPQLDLILSDLMRDDRGLILVAGHDARFDTLARNQEAPLPSGRSTFFRLVIDQLIATRKPKRVAVISDRKDFLRINRAERRNLQLSMLHPSGEPSEVIEQALDTRPEVLIVERTSAENLSVVLEAAKQDTLILSQIDTIFWGVGLIKQIVEMGAAVESLSGIAWILAVQRVAKLCPECRREDPEAMQKLERLAIRHPVLEPVIRSQFLGQRNDQEPPQYGVAQSFSSAGGCQRCQNTGRAGEAAVFDVFRREGNGAEIFTQSSLLPLERYLFQMAQLSYLSLDDVIDFESGNLHQVHNLLLDREREYHRLKANSEAKLAELEAANRVLEQRTRTLIALEDIGQALIASVELNELAARVCRRACELSGGDRAVLYLQTTAEVLEILATEGWEVDPQRRKLAVRSLTGTSGKGMIAYNHVPPGVMVQRVLATRQNERQPARRSRQAGEFSGILVDLVAQKEHLGALVVQSSQKHDFKPGEVSTLQAFANQAALALQRAGLVYQLQQKISQLESAQAELAKKERMEHELELARDVQQSVLLREFPHIKGYQFAAQYEPARRVGGDFYDVIVVDPEHIAIAIADVSDKGLPAALYMALTHSLLRAEARRELSPERVVASVNQLLQELGEPSMFVTLFYGVIHTGSGRMAYTRAGHERPLLIHDGSVMALAGAGTPLGILSEQDFYQSEEEVQLSPGDRLVLFTDGLVDISRPDGETLGYDRFIELLQNHAQNPAEKICTNMFAALEDFREDADPFDDMTMLLVEVESG